MEPGPVGEVRAEHLRYEVGGRLVLDDLSFTARAGRTLAVTGPSGSGKTSLLLLLAGLDTPAGGRVVVRLAGNAAPDGTTPFAVVLQTLGLLPTLTAAENVSLPLQARRLPRDEIDRRCRSALAALGLADVASHLGEELSGGQRQRLALARAVAMEAPVLVVDEPTGELDPVSRRLVVDLLVGEARRGRVVIVATHDPEVARVCEDEVALVR